jgi:hypothetical protein
MRIVVWLLVLAGCDDLFNLEHIDPQRDGAALDAFDPDVDCPQGYDLALFAGSRYRVTESSYAAYDSSDDCNDDKLGFTHLAVAPTNAEVTALHDSLIAKGFGRWWLGGVQPAAGVTDPIQGWLWVTGEPVDVGQWAIGEPNDGDADEQDHIEQFMFIDETVPGLVDLLGSFGNRALCECDGRPVTEEARIAIDQGRM